MAAFVSASAAGCSTSIFTGDKANDRKTGSGEVNSACFGIDLSNEVLNPTSARGLVRCLNSNGSIAAYEALLGKMSDPQLQALLDVVNELLILNKRRLKELDRSLVQMDSLQLGSQRLLDRGMGNLARILANRKFLTSGLKLLRRGATQGGKTDPALLTSLRILAEEISGGRGTVANLRRGLDFGIRGTNLESFREMANRLRAGIPVGRPGLLDLTKAFLGYVRHKLDPKSGAPAMGKVMLWGIADGTLFEAFDDYYYGQCENTPGGKCSTGGVRLSLDAQVLAMESFLGYLTAPENREILASFMKFYRLMDRPVDCMDGTKQVPNVNMHLMDEFASLDPAEVPFWAMRTGAMKLKVAASMCELPPNINPLLDSLKSLAKHVDGVDTDQDHRLLATVAHFIQGLQVGDRTPLKQDAFNDTMFIRDPEEPALLHPAHYPDTERYRRFLISWLGDPSAVNALQIADGLYELTRKDRRFTANLLYFLNAAAPGSDDRELLRSAVGSLLASRSELRVAEASAAREVPGTNPLVARSAYDVLMNAVMKTDAGTLYDLLSSTGYFLESTERFIGPLLSDLRDGLLMNDVHPLVDLTLDLARTAEKRQVFFDTLLEISEWKEIDGALELTERMAAKGTLKELLLGMLTLYRSGTLGEGVNPALADIPSVTPPDRDRDRSTGGPPNAVYGRISWASEAAVDTCAAIDVDELLTRTSSRLWKPQLETLAACVDHGDRDGSFAQFVEYSLRHRIKGQSAPAFLVDMGRKMLDIPDTSTRKRAFDEFSDLLTDDATFRYVHDFHELFRYSLWKPYCTDERYNDVSCPADRLLGVTQGAFRVFANLGDQPEARVRPLLALGGDTIASSALPKAVALAFDLSSAADGMAPPQATAKPPLLSMPLNADPPNDLLDRQLRKTVLEYEKIPMDQVEARLQEIRSNYWRQVQAGKPNFGYANAGEFKAALKPLLDEISIHKGAIDYTLIHFRRFFGNPYSPEWFESWFQRLGANVRAIPYFYPGQYPGKNKPTVRLVNQLDLLDLVVIDADFALAEIGTDFGWKFANALMGQDMNEVFAIKHLSRLAQSGKDMQGWIDSMDRELVFFESLVESILSFQIKDEVKRRLFNLRQIFPVLQELHCNNDLRRCDKSEPNDLGVLRDLFKDVLSATPKGNWNKYFRDKNSLHIITKLVSFGLLRNVGINMWEVVERGREHDNGGRVRPSRVAQILRFLRDASHHDISTRDELNGDTKAVVEYLLLKDHNCPRCATFDDRYALVGEIISRLFEWMGKDEQAFTNIKRGGYNLSLLIERLTQNPDTLRHLLAALRPALATKSGVKMLRENFDVLEDILSGAKNANLLTLLLDAADHGRVERNYDQKEAFRDLIRLAREALAKLAAPSPGAPTVALFGDEPTLAEVAVETVADLYNDPGQPLQRLGDAIDQMKIDPGYVEFKKDTLDPVLDGVIHWMVNPDGEKALPPQLQRFMAARMRGEGTHDERQAGRPLSRTHDDADLLALIRYVGANTKARHGQLSTSIIYSDELYSKLRFIGEDGYLRGFQDFIDMLRRSIVDIHDPKAL